MAATRRRRYSSRYRRRRYARRWRRGSVLRSWQNGTRNFKAIVRQTQTINFTIPVGSQTSDVFVLCPWSNTAPPIVGVCGKVNYTRWTTLFDEVKCDWMSVTASPAVVGAAGTVGRAMNFLIDRKFNINEGTLGAVSVLDAGNVITRRFNSNTASSARVSVRASNLEERTKFHDCSLSGAVDAEWNAGQDVGFSPGIYLVCSVDAPVTGAAVTLSWVVEMKYQFTFRSIKYE